MVFPSPSIVTLIRHHFFITINRPWRSIFLFFAVIASFGTLATEFRRPTNAEIYFRLANPCPSTGETHGACPGYVVDRIIPTVCGGAEEQANMQWQTLAQAKDKDRWERIGCRRGRKLVLPGDSPNVTEASPIGGIGETIEAQPLPAGSRAPQPTDDNADQAR